MKDYLLITIPLFLLLSCCTKKVAVDGYNTNQAFIYFQRPLFNLGNATDRMDSLSFSFAFEADSLMEKTLVFPIQLIGQQKNHDRPIEFRIIGEHTTIPDSLFTVIPPVMRAGRFQDSLLIRVRRNAILQERRCTLAGILHDSDSFKIGNAEVTVFKLFISDQLLEPTWWFNWKDVFGVYKKEIFKQWIAIYSPGIDATQPVSPMDKSGFSWNNMPFTDSRIDYPVTFFYVDRLREYFEKNAVYPDGDNSKPRIYLPQAR